MARADDKKAAGKPGAAPAGKPSTAAGAHVPVTAKLAAERAAGPNMAHVKVHSGAGKPSLGAQAFTKGSEPAFKAPAHQPIVAHEAAHVVQQRAGHGPKP